MADRIGTAGRDRLRLAAVSLGALTLCAAYVWRGYFSSDFWEHAAVVRELSVRPFAPTHPLLAIDAPHAYFSPYLLVLGLTTRGIGASPVWVLAAAGLVNVVLLVLALRRFLVRLLPGGEAAAPYALLFILFLWGRDAWPWSGFLHVGFLGYAASYPSTFAAAAMFLAWSLLLDWLGGRRPLSLVGIGLLVALCLITHPPTALVLLAGLAAIFLARVQGNLVANGAVLAGAVGAGTAAALAWPYFPVLQLFVAQPPEFHAWSAVFYQGVPAQIWPALVALPVLLWRLRRDRRDALVLLAILLAAVYALGAATGKYGLGRVIAYIVVCTQIALGAAVADWESRLPARRAWLAPAAALVVSLALFAYDRPPLPRILRYQRPLWRELAGILGPVRPGDVVLADSYTSYPVPVLTGGRVVAWRHPVYWVPDHAQRREAQDRFFGAATDDERRAVIARYHVRWVLVNRQAVHLEPREEERLRDLGCVVAERDSLALVAPGRPCPPPQPPT